MPHRPSPTVVAGLIQALAPHAPFSALPEGELRRIVEACRIQYFSPGEAILRPDAARPGECFVIRQGAVRGERPGADGDARALWELSPGEMFPLGALLGHRGVTSVYRAQGDTFCIAFPAAVFDALLESSPPFQDFCNRRLAHLLDLSRARLQSAYAAAVTEERGTAAPLSSLTSRPPVVLPPDAPIGDALAAMERARIGSIVVAGEDGVPLGIFTRQDVIGRIVLPGVALDRPLRDVMSAPVRTLPDSATAGDAAILMAQHGFRHVVVVGAGGAAAGVVSERDLFGLQRLSVRELSSAIRRAQDADALARCVADVRSLSHALVAQGVSAEALTRMIASLNDRITERLLDVVAPGFDLSGMEVAWLGMGSEGRGEQTIATDQDNGIVFVPRDPVTVDAARERLLPFARAVNEALDRLGYPLCTGGVMAMNPRWCASLDEWRDAFFGWIDRGDPESLLASSIFFDFRALWGNASLVQRLRSDVATRAKGNQRFLKQMSDNALRNRAPLNWLGGLATTEDDRGDDGIDLKLHAAVPIVDAARIYALATGVTATNTVERLREAGERKGMPEQEVRDVLGAFEFVQMQRLRAQHRARSSPGGGRRNPNWIRLADLSDLDQRILKEVLRQVRRLQQRLELDYPG